MRAASSASTRRSIRRRGWSRCAPRSPIPDGELRPASSCACASSCRRSTNVIALPQTALVTSLYGDYVYVVEETKRAEPAAARSSAAGRSGAERQAASRAEAPPPARCSPSRRGPQLVARQVFVKIGRRQGNLIEIVEGLEAGQTVVTSGPEQARQQHAGHHRQHRRSGGGGARRRERTRVNFSEIFIRRPVLTIVTAILILLLGLQGFFNLSVRQYPEVEEIGHHDHHGLSRRQRRPDAGLHHHADRQGGAERRERRLRHLVEHARLEHRLGATCSSAPTPTRR